MSEQTLVAIVGCIAVLVLMLIRVPIAVSLGSVAVAGFAWLVGPGPALGILIDSPIRTVTNFNFSVMPMFILMGAIVSASGMSRELFRAAQCLGRASARRHGDRHHLRLRRLCGDQRLVGRERGHHDARWRCRRCGAPATTPGSRPAWSRPAARSTS